MLLDTVWGAETFFSPAAGSRLRLPLKKAWLLAPWSRFYKFLLLAPAPIPPKKARLPASIFRGFLPAPAPYIFLPAPAPCKKCWLPAPRLRLPNTA